MKSLDQGITGKHDFRCPTALWQQFKDKCKAKGIKPAEVLRQLITSYID